MAFVLADRFRNAIASNAAREGMESSSPSIPPTFDIDLSLPPEQRYLELGSTLRGQLNELKFLLDDLGAQILAPIPASWLHIACWLCLRYVYDQEQTRELRGISAVSGVAMYILVLFNTVLDLTMGCSSGGARVSDDRTPGVTKMVHFRALDWVMPTLRQLVVQLHFRETPDGPIIASCLTYAGHVGCLTGVRPGLSLSQNFRSSRNDAGKLGADFAYFWHVIMVLLGQRPGIASILRSFLLPHTDANARSCPPCSYTDAVRDVASLRTPTSYLTFCNGQETTIFEKDHVSAIMDRSNSFIAVTNNDAASQPRRPQPPGKEQISSVLPGADEMLQDSINRRRCVQENWFKLNSEKTRSPGIRIDDVVELVQKYPTTNKTTHFACVMDPERGTIYWCRRWENPIGDAWIRVHT